MRQSRPARGPTALHLPLRSNYEMPSYTEEDMADAIFDVIDNGLSKRQSATKHGVPLMTLCDHMLEHCCRRRNIW
jgi:hypothetical protein